MSATISIVYHFEFGARSRKTVAVELDHETLALRTTPPVAPPAWATLDSNQCTVCPFTTATTPTCPIALNLAAIVEEFKDFFSYEEVDVTVETAARSYRQQTSLQTGLSSLIGIIMVTSGCRPMEQLKPMVRFHLPFATLEETTFRTVSMHLVGQYLRREQGLPADFSLNGLQTIYNDVAAVNTCFAKRLLEAARKDANINALVNLHCFAEMVPLNVNDLLDDIAHDFSALSS
jgi:hypothetical protein